MLAYRSGDTGAFEILYRRHKDGLFAFLYRSNPRSAVVEELAQDTWMAVINAAGRYKPEARFRTWLYQIAHNRLVDHWRRQGNSDGEFDENSEVVVGHNDSNHYEREELKNHLMHTLAQLPREQKDALLLQEQGFSLTDIAAITGTGAETVKSRLRYGRDQLRELLGDYL